MVDHRLSTSTHALSHARYHARHHLPPAMRLERRSSPPCPGADGESIGTGLILTLSCGTSLDGEVLDTIDEATSLEQCANFCGTFHPRCDGVNFSEDDGCRLIGGFGGAGQSQSSFNDDSATAEYPTLPASSCRDGEQTTSGGEGFEAMCGRVINGGDIVQRHTQTYEECGGECAEMMDCTAFSFEESMDQGFMNCYLKSEFDEADISFVAGVDTGVMSAGNASSPPESRQSEIPNSGGFFSIVPGGSASAAPTTQSTPEPTQPEPEAPSTIQTPVVTQVVTAPLDSSTAANQAEPAAGSANLSWVAAPVVGGVAAMLVVGVLLIMFRKRRNGSAAGSRGWKGILGLGGGRGRGMERLGDAEARGVPVYEVKDGKVALRNSGESAQRPLTGLFRTG